MKKLGAITLIVVWFLFLLYLMGYVLRGIYTALEKRSKYKRVNENKTNSDVSVVEKRIQKHL